MFLVVINAHSKWPEVIDFMNNTKTYRVIKVYKKLFSRFGLPMHIVTDNEHQFTNAEFENFLKINKVVHLFSPLYHPATNGAAENFVQTFNKDKVEKIVKGGRSLSNVIEIFLFDYCSCKHCTTGKRPAVLMNNKELRTRFDMLRPTRTQAVVEKNQRE